MELTKLAHLEFKGWEARAEGKARQGCTALHCRFVTAGNTLGAIIALLLGSTAFIRSIYLPLKLKSGDQLPPLSSRG